MHAYPAYYTAELHNVCVSCPNLQTWLPLVAETLLAGCIGAFLQLASSKVLENQGISLLLASLCNFQFSLSIPVPAY